MKPAVRMVVNGSAGTRVRLTCVDGDFIASKWDLMCLPQTAGHFFSIIAGVNQHNIGFAFERRLGCILVPVLPLGVGAVTHPQIYGRVRLRTARNVQRPVEIP